MTFHALNQFIKGTSLKPRIYQKFKLNSTLVRGRLLLKGNFYDPKEYYNHLQLLHAAFEQEKKTFQWTLNDVKNKVEHLEYLQEILDSSSARGGQYYSPEIEKIKKKGDFRQVDFDIKIETNNDLPELIVDKETLKDIDKAFGSFEKYQSLRSFYLFYVSESFIDASIGLIKEEIKLLIVQQKKIAQNAKSPAIQTSNEKPELSKSNQKDDQQTLSNAEPPIQPKDEPNDSKLNERPLQYGKSHKTNTIRAITAPKVLKLRIPSNLTPERLDEIQNNQRFTLLDLYSFLVKNDFIKEKSRVEGFLNVFLGDRVKENEKIRWKGAQVELKVFVDLLATYLEFNGREKWLMISRCFAQIDGASIDSRKIAKSDRNEIKFDRNKLLNDFFRKNFHNKVYFFPKHNPE